MYDTTTSIGELATLHPAAARVFERHGIDYCCGGKASLADACAQRGLDASALIEEIQRDETARPAPERRFDEASVDELVDHIVDAFHKPLKAELPRLKGLALKVLGAHGPKDPDRFQLLARIVDHLDETLREHMELEERELFPKLRDGTVNVADLGEVVADEHEEVGSLLREIRRLTRDYVVPPEACRSWTALWQGLEALETSLHQHIHLENNVLLPRAQ